MELSAKVEEVQQSVVVRQESRSGEIRGHPANPPPIRREILLLQQHPRRGDGDEIQLQPLLHKVRNEHIKMINLILIPQLSCYQWRLSSRGFSTSMASSQNCQF